MKETPGRAFEIRSKDVPVGAFLITVLPFGTEVKDEIQPDDLVVLFTGDGSRANDLFGPEIAKSLQREGYNVGIAFNPDEDADMSESLST